MSPTCPLRVTGTCPACPQCHGPVCCGGGCLFIAGGGGECSVCVCVRAYVCALGLQYGGVRVRAVGLQCLQGARVPAVGAAVPHCGGGWGAMRVCACTCACVCWGCSLCGGGRGGGAVHALAHVHQEPQALQGSLWVLGGGGVNTGGLQTHGGTGRARLTYFKPVPAEQDLPTPRFPPSPPAWGDRGRDPPSPFPSLPGQGLPAPRRLPSPWGRAERRESAGGRRDGAWGGWGGGVGGGPGAPARSGRSRRAREPPGGRAPVLPARDAGPVPVPTGQRPTRDQRVPAWRPPHGPGERGQGGAGGNCPPGGTCVCVCVRSRSFPAQTCPVPHPRGPGTPPPSRLLPAPAGATAGACAPSPV